MMTAWIKNLQTDDEKARFESSLKSSKPVLNRLTQLLIEEEEGIDRSELQIDTYESAAWASKQAHKNGQRAMLRKIKNLINLDQQETL